MQTIRTEKGFTSDADKALETAAAVAASTGSKTAWSLRTQGGFIALISAILIAVSLLILTVAVGFGGFFGRFAILDSEVKEMSNFLAEACVNTAIIKLVQDDTYTGDEYIPVGKSSCRVVSVADDGSGTYTITTQASSTGAYTNLVVDVDGNGVVSSWREVPGP